MGKIFCLIGKSGSGKDTLYRRLINDSDLDLEKYVTHTTRPEREGETDGLQYYFVSENDYQYLKKVGKVIEERTYETMKGEWRYFTVQDDRMDLRKYSYLIIGTIETFQALVRHFGREFVRYIYVEVEDSIRLERLLLREKDQINSNYEEICRRFITDSADFSDERLSMNGIDERIQNTNLDECYQAIKKKIQQELGAKRPKFDVIVLIGSTRFEKEMRAEENRLTMEGYIVWPLDVLKRSDVVGNNSLKHMLDEMIREKIDFSDRVHVINKDGYIGKSTRSEIEYAKKKGKMITFMVD